jgi:murein DD-endopeptidase MepM/ murein hydrolase activator NlpD
VPTLAQLFRRQDDLGFQQNAGLPAFQPPKPPAPPAQPMGQGMGVPRQSFPGRTGPPAMQQRPMGPPSAMMGRPQMQRPLGPPSGMRPQPMGLPQLGQGMSAVAGPMSAMGLPTGQAGMGAPSQGPAQTPDASNVPLPRPQTAMGGMGMAQGGGGNFSGYQITQGFGPTNERLDSAYGGYANFNKGLDFAMPVGTPVGATTGGRVISVGDVGDGWGTRVWVEDAEGNIHNYGHLSGVNVRQGDQVQPGQIVGASGNTGKSTGPHLSYDVRDAQGNYFDPSRFL